ncbi:MAG: alpha-xylosidase [Prevotellaceae bacterium]|nr:alpha-xylosidase [Candidatus Minthosoma caballi]
MNYKRMLRGLAVAVAACVAVPGHAQLTINNGVQYLQDQSKDMSQEFSDMSNIYFFADSLVNFDTATGKGTLKWKRHQLQPRQAFNANTFLHQPLQMLDFPTPAYDNDPQLQFAVEPVNARTLRVRVYTSPIVPKDNYDDEVMLVGKPADGSAMWTKTVDAKGVTYKSAEGSMSIEAYPWRIVLRDKNGKEMTHSRVWSDNDSSQVKAQPFCFMKRGSDNSRAISPVFSLAPSEKIFGCGESFTSLNKAGQKVNLFVTDPQGPETPDMYKPIPFFFSNRGYGMFMHTSAPVTCDFGQSYIGATKLFMADEQMDFFIFFGQPKEILSAYTELVGRPEMPPLWSFGTWQSRITYFSEDEGREVAKKLRDLKIPTDVIHFDTGWFGVDWQCDYQFAKDRFKNPGKMLSDMKKDGFHVCLWQLPYFTPKNKYFNELVEKGLYVHNEKGQLPYEDAVLDFTNPATVAWYQEKLEGLLKLGVGVIKADFGEAAPFDKAIYSNGKGGLYEHNLYPVRYNKAAYDIIKKTNNGEGIIWARSAWAGSQRYPLHWGGDAATTNTGLQGDIRGGLSFGLSGFSFWSNDMGGFVTKSPEKLYRRWLPYGFLTSHSRAHGVDTEPWLYNEDFINYYRECAEMKYKLMPYVYAQAKISAANGWPMQRALLLDYPDDPGAWSIEDEYLFGEQMLVAPMLEEGDGRDVYLPGKFSWIDYQTGTVYAPGWQHIKCGKLPIVILVKDGSAIPHVPVAQSTDKIDWSKVEWKTYKVDHPVCRGWLCLPSDGKLVSVDK